jgi:hypothetical protein
VLPYTHAVDPALARALAHVVASAARAQKRPPDLAQYEAEATTANDQSGAPTVKKGRPTPAKATPAKATPAKATPAKATPTPARVPKTRYTTMSKFNAAQIIKRRETKKRERTVRRDEKVARRVAVEEAARFLKQPEEPEKATVRKKILKAPARMTPGRRAVAA